MVEAAITAMNIPAADPMAREDPPKMVDLYDTDIVSLYRSYARRMSGEVALAQYGIMGRRDCLPSAPPYRHRGEGPIRGRSTSSFAPSIR